MVASTSGFRMATAARKSVSTQYSGTTRISRLRMKPRGAGVALLGGDEDDEAADHEEDIDACQPDRKCDRRVGIVHPGELVAGMERHHQHGGKGAQILEGNDHKRCLGQPEVRFRLAALH